MYRLTSDSRNVSFEPGPAHRWRTGGVRRISPANRRLACSVLMSGDEVFESGDFVIALSYGGDGWEVRV